MNGKQYALALLPSTLALILLLTSSSLRSQQAFVDNKYVGTIGSTKRTQKLIWAIKDLIGPFLPHRFAYWTRIPTFPDLPLPTNDDEALYQDFSIQDLPVQNCNESSDAFLIISQTGDADFPSVQAAIDAVPDYNSQRIVLLIAAGTYVEKVTIPITKPCITFQGESSQNTTIAWNDTASFTHSTRASASVALEAPNFIARNISFRNTAPPPNPGAVGAQAVALRISADEVAFYGCGVYGAQDTLYDEMGRHYFKECFIEGSIDFIFGNGRSLYEGCELHSIARASKHRYRVTGAITAHGRQNAADRTGFSFVNCKITGTGKLYLGRAWGAYAFTVFSYTYMPDAITPIGWNDWNDPTRDQTVFFGEYMCEGPGANTSGRVRYSNILNDTLAAPFLNISYIDGEKWLLDYVPQHLLA